MHSTAACAVGLSCLHIQWEGVPVVNTKLSMHVGVESALCNSVLRYCKGCQAMEGLLWSL